MVSISTKICVLLLTICNPLPLNAQNYFLNQLQSITGGLANSFNKNAGNSQINVVNGPRKKSNTTTEPSLEKVVAAALKADEQINFAKSGEPTPPAPAMDDVNVTSIPTPALNKGNSSSNANKAETDGPQNKVEVNNSLVEDKFRNSYEKKVQMIVGGVANSMNENAGNSFINIQNIED